MLQIGCHLSSSKGFLHMGKEALSIHATTFQFFTRNPRGSKVKALDIDDINALLKLMDEHEIEHVVAPCTVYIESLFRNRTNQRVCIGNDAG